MTPFQQLWSTTIMLIPTIYIGLTKSWLIGIILLPINFIMSSVIGFLSIGFMIKNSNSYFVINVFPYVKGILIASLSIFIGKIL